VSGDWVMELQQHHHRMLEHDPADSMKIKAIGYQWVIHRHISP